MEKRLLSILLVISLLLQSSGLLFAQDGAEQSGGEQAIHKIFLPAISGGASTESTAQPTDMTGQLFVDFAPGTNPAYINQVYAQLNNGDVQAAYTAGPHWQAKMYNPNIGDFQSVTARGIGGSYLGQSLILTWSIVPDSTSMASSGLPRELPCTSNLIATYDSRYGAGVWQAMFEKVFADWSAVSGIVFEREMGPTGQGFDDGAAWPNASGEIGKRGDIRIGGCNLDGPGGVAGFGYTPNTGDLKLDTTEVNLLLNSTLRLTLAHEVGHTLGLYHTCPDGVPGVSIQPYSWLMHSFDTLSNTGRYGPQHDDIRGIQRQYGDRYEKPGNNNNSAVAATDLGTLTLSSPLSMTTLSLDSLSDKDWFRLNATANLFLDVKVSPVGQIYPLATMMMNLTCPTDAMGMPISSTINSQTLQDLGVEVLDSNGTTILTTANSNGAGLAETLSNIPLGAAGAKYIRVFGTGTDDVQMYDLQVTLKASATAPTNTPAAPTATATNTAIPATATATNTNTPLPPTATTTATNTPIPPTATATATKTPLPPTATATNTAPPATATPTATPTSATPPVTQACYWIENKLTGYVLDVNGSHQNRGERAIVWTKNPTTTANQLWYFNSDGSISSKLNGLLLDINGGNPAQGTNIILWTRNVPASNNQLWNQVTQSNGYITIQSRLQNYLLDVQNASTTVGTSAVTWPQGNPIPSNQLWKLTQAPAVTCAADLSAPWSQPSQSPAANSNGWNNTDVTVTWNWSDYGGSGLNTATCPASSTSSGQGTITLTATCKDNAGNTGNASYTVKVDKTLPVVTGSTSSGGVVSALSTTSSGFARMSASGAASESETWFNKDVLVDFICADGGAEPSGVAENSVTSAILNKEGAGQSVTSTGDCVDQAGNRALPATVAQINIDKTAPVVDCSIDLSSVLQPDETLKDITVKLDVNDSLSGNGGFTLVDIDSNQPEICVVGDDIQGWAPRSADLTGQLRAESGEDESGRVYTLTYLGKDKAGNMALCNTNVTVAPPSPEQSAARFQSFVALGQEGVILRDGVTVQSGDVAANLASTGPWLGDAAEVSIGQNVTFANTKSRILGDTLFIGQGTTAHDVGYNELTGTGTVQGQQSSPQTLPLLAPFISMPEIAVGTESIDVPANGNYTLTPGSYGSLHVADGGSVTFTGGLYSFSEWNVGDNSKLSFAAASEVRIAGRALVGMHSYVGPVANSGITPKQIVIFVAGVNADNNVLGGLGPKAATFGPYATVGANVVALNGTLLIRERSLAVGSFVARWVSVGKFSQLVAANRFDPNSIPIPFTANGNLNSGSASGANATAPLSSTVNDELKTNEGVQ